MHPASEHHIPDGLLAAGVLLSEKPRHGVTSKNPALNQGINEANSTAAIGLRAGLLLNRVQSRFTGKERDAESGLDFFGARYYASTTGRWMSPDWAAKPEAVPYSSLGDPQSLNLYNYVGNNPLSKADADGHDPDPQQQKQNPTPPPAPQPPAPQPPQNTQQPTTQQTPAGASAPPHPPPSPRDVAKAQIEKANDNFNKCVVKGTATAVASGVVEEGLDKGSEKPNEPGNSTETKMATNAATNVMDLHRECLRANPTADLSPNYKGAFHMGDIIPLNFPSNLFDPNSK